MYFDLVPGLRLVTSVDDRGPFAKQGTNFGPANRLEADMRVVALAKLQPAAGIVDLGGIPGDKVERLSVKRGQAVRRGDELIVFESRKLRQIERDLAAIQLDEATRRLRTEQAHADTLVQLADLTVAGLSLDALELSAQKHKLRALDSAAETARHEYDRVTRLDDSIASTQQRERVALTRSQAEAELAAAGELLKKLEAANELRKREAQASRDQAAAARAKVDAVVPLESLRQTLTLADERLRLSSLRAPTDGVVLDLLADEGDVVGQMPLVRVADVRRMVAVAEVYETQVAAVRVGQRCRIFADSLPDKLEGVVEQIGSLVGANRLVSLDPRRSTDDRVVEVRIQLNDPDGAAARLVGLQVSAEIELKTDPSAASDASLPPK